MDKEKKELSYWNEQLKILKDTEKFIWDYCNESSYKKGIYKQVVDDEYGNKLSDICKNNRLLMYTFLASTLKITLSKYMGKNDIVIGIPCYNTENNRGNVNINKLLPLVSYIDHEKTYLEYMDSIKTKVLQSYKNKAYLSSKILVQNDLPNDVMELTPISICMKGIHEDRDINYICESSKNELSFLLDITEDKSISIQIVYNSNKITEVTVKALYECYETALRDILNNYNKKIKDIKILCEKDIKKILYEFNDTEIEYPKDKTIHELFEEQVEKTPDNIAVVFEDKKLTYKELNERSNSLARVLRDRGVKADSIVGIMVERSLEMIVGIMGILKAGGAYLPIDPNYPKERIEYMLKDSESKILLSSNALVETLEFNAKFIDIFNKSLFSEDFGNLDKINNSTNLVYVIYTSGTTGNPKGVMIEHRNLNNLIMGLNRNIYQKYNRVLRVGLVSPYYFDASVKQVFSAILNGHSLYIVGEDVRRDGEKLLKYYEDEGIEIADGTPMHLKMMMNSNLFQANKLCINHYVIGGEELQINTVKDFYKYAKRNVSPCISNVYGPTECCVDSSIFFIDDKKVNDLTTIPIGRPMSNYKLYIVNNYNQMLPIGVSGELCISGDGVARGYLNKPELTAEKFIDNPFEPGTKMYKTGDLARWLPDGNVEFLGRKDNQVKIRGFRIELGEIENRLLQNESIKEAAVLVRENKEKDKYICAYVVNRDSLEELNLKSYLKETLPEYMVPTYFVQIEKMPMTNNGKINRKALPEVNLDETLVEYEAPRNKGEETLAKIWSEVLGIEKVGINDNFFDIGGHSLKATVLMSKIHKELNKEVPLKQLFKAPTIKQLSKYIESAQENLQSKIEKVEEKEYYQASSAQKRMYILQEFDKDSTAYNMPIVFEIEGSFDKNKIEETFRELIKRHEALRTYFETLDGEIIQKLQYSHDFELVYKNKNVDIEEIINAFVRPFNLEKAPLFRVQLAENKEKTYLLIDMHHIVSDGVSMGILMKEFVELYSGKTLETLKLQYKDFSAWQNNFFKSEEMRKQKEYWINRFSDEIPVLNMPIDYERPAMQSFEGDSVRFQVSEEITLKLRKLIKETGTTMNMVLLSAFNILLSKYSAQEDIVIGTPIAGRVHGDIQNIMGMFVNTLALRNKPEGNKKYIDFLKEVKENCLKAYENQSYQFEALVEKLDIRRDASRNPLFDVMFNMVDTVTSGDIKLDDIILKQHNNESKISKFDLTLNALESDAKLNFNIEYCSKLFKKETIERLSNHYVRMLDIIANNKEIKLCEVDLLSKVEKNQILYEFNDTKVDYPRDKTIHELFEVQVEKTPDNIAVICGDKKLTYRELNERANSLAEILRDKGVKGDSIVAIMVEKSLEMIVGIMGILKAGGAYLPIDPTYPNERIEYMLRDSKTKIVLSTKELLDFQAFNLEIIDLSDEDIFIKKVTNLQMVATSNNLAYILYTSGSTGKPKGVMVEHKAVINLLTWFKKEYEICQQSRLLQATNYTFDVSIEEIFGALLNGASLYLVNLNNLINKEGFKDFVDKNRITLAQFVPSTLEILIGNSNKINGLKTLICGGEKLDGTLKNKVLEKEYNLFNHYGPTEITVDAITTRCHKEFKNIIGRPIQNTKIYILNNRNQIVPIGVSGEICIGGSGVARGYLNNSQLTAEKFIDNPFEVGTKMYKTGDLARWLPDGNVEFLGRVDDQVKIRGFRIELGEIENRLLQHENIKEAAVLLKENKKGEKYICAYIVSEKKFEELNLKSFLKKMLPEYMVPAYFKQLEKMPLTDNGKINRRVLPELKLDVALTEYESPRNKYEETLAKIWSEVLGVEKVGINDNFFEIGGHSLLSVKMLSLVNNAFGINISMNDFLMNPNIKGINLIISSINRQENIYEEIENRINDIFFINVKLRDYQINSKKYIILYCDSKFNDITKFIRNEYSNKFLPNYILSIEDFNSIKNESDLVRKIKYKTIQKGNSESVINDIYAKNTSQYNEINKAISLGKMKDKYLCSSSQCKIFKKQVFGMIPCIIPINNILKHIEIYEALKRTINMNPLLRSKVVFQDKHYFCIESDFLHDLNMELVDVSNYEDKYVKDLKWHLFGSMSSILNRSDKLNNCLFTFMLVKLNEKDYELLMLFNHLIFDAASITIMKRHIYKNLKEVIEGVENYNNESESLNYKEYVNELNTNTTIDKINKYKNSEEYLDIVKVASKYNRQYYNNLKLKEYIFEYSYDQSYNYGFSMGERNEGLALWISSNIARIIFECDYINFRVTKNGRVLGDKNFNNVIGDYHTVIPVMINTKCDDITDYLNKVNHVYNKFYINEKIYIDYIANGDYKDKKHNKEIKEMYLSLDIGFNYIGEFTEEEYENAYNTIKVSNKTHKSYFITAFSYKDKLGIVCRLPEDYESEKIDRIRSIEDEFAKL